MPLKSDGTINFSWFGSTTPPILQIIYIYDYNINIYIYMIISLTMILSTWNPRNHATHVFLGGHFSMIPTASRRMGRFKPAGVGAEPWHAEQKLLTGCVRLCCPVDWGHRWCQPGSNPPKSDSIDSLILEWYPASLNSPEPSPELTSSGSGMINGGITCRGSSLHSSRP